MSTPEPPIKLGFVRTDNDFNQIRERIVEFGDVAYAIVTKEHGVTLMARAGEELCIPELKCDDGAQSAHLIARTLEAAGFGSSAEFTQDALRNTKLTLTRHEGCVRLQVERIIG